MARIIPYFRNIHPPSGDIRLYSLSLLCALVFAFVVMLSPQAGPGRGRHRIDAGSAATESVRSTESSEFDGPTPAGGVVQSLRHGERRALYPQPSNLAMVYDRLAADADRGDRLATCVLSRALALCDIQFDKQANTDMLIDAAARYDPGSDDESRFVALLANQQPIPSEPSTLCRGLPASRLREKDARMLQAAQLGDPLAMTHFALYTMTSDLIDDAPNDFDEEYRIHAVAMLHRSASMGDIAALRRLLMVYLYGTAPNNSKIGRVDPDPEAALAISDALFNVISDEQKRDIASLLAKEKISIETVDINRYSALKERYRGYVGTLPISRFDDPRDNTNIKDCWDQR